MDACTVNVHLDVFILKNIHLVFKHIWKTNEGSRVEMFIGINMQNENYFKTACLWRLFKLFNHNMKVHVLANLDTLCTQLRYI